MIERWMAIKGYEGLYEISNLGNVRSLWFGKRKILKQKKGKNGYYSVTLCKNGIKKKEFLVHRLVVISFLGPIPEGYVVNHLNENKLDNRLSNLEICTQKENTNYGTGIQRRSKAISIANKGKQLGNTNGAKQLDLIKCDYPYNELTFVSSYEASDFFGYKSKKSVGLLIHRAKRRKENFIKINKEKYFFVKGI